MTTLIAALCCMGVLGIAFGLGLAVAAKRFHVDTDPRIEEVYEALPGVDCGACGYPGCAGYAEAVAVAGVDVGLCVPGGEDIAHAVARIMGAEVGAPKEKARAVVLCQGGWGVARREFDYAGVDDCRAAQLVQGGPKACKFGCLGLGTCALVCPFDAITMGDDGLPAIDEERCTACGVCVKSCPVGIMTILPSKHRVYFACSNPAAKGKAMKELCERGCIKCRLCVKATESGAVTWAGDLPEIDYEAWTDPDAAVAKCPQHCFADERSGAAAEREAAG